MPLRLEVNWAGFLLVANVNDHSGPHNHPRAAMMLTVPYALERMRRPPIYTDGSLRKEGEELTGWAVVLIDEQEPLYDSAFSSDFVLFETQFLAR